MDLFKGFGRKHRKYSIKRDQYGRSARQRCFDLFDEGVTLAEISKTVGITVRTVYKYHQQWKRQPNLEGMLTYAKSCSRTRLKIETAS